MKEMGGYLPLELQRREAYYQFPEEQMKRVNCGRAAIYAALCQFQPKRVLIPFFICPTVKTLIKKLNIACAEYSITDEFLPRDLQWDEEDCVVLVNYFGLVDHRKLAMQLAKKVKVVIDNTQAFYAAPVFHANILNVYSCRKFFGVPDGGYLIGEKVNPIQLEQGFSWQNVSFLIKSLECGTNSAYQLKKEYEEKLGNIYTAMSKFTDAMMHTIDYNNVACKRRENFKILHKFLSEKNEINWMMEDHVPYSYPLMVRHDMRDYLLSNKIYVPMIWKENIEQVPSHSTESDFAKWIYHLPIDQRYNEEDMRYLAALILKETGK